MLRKWSTLGTTIVDGMQTTNLVEKQHNRWWIQWRVSEKRSRFFLPFFFKRKTNSTPRVADWFQLRYNKIQELKLGEYQNESNKVVECKFYWFFLSLVLRVSSLQFLHHLLRKSNWKVLNSVVNGQSQFVHNDNKLLINGNKRRRNVASWLTENAKIMGEQ